MKLRDLKLRPGKATGWPPRWVEFAGSSEPVPEAVERLGNRLFLQLSINGRQRTASLEWDPPPSVGAVEAMLLASIGVEVRDLANRELPTRTGGAHR